MKVIVLGAGIIGTASAWFLNQAGHEVTVIDRAPGAALETSFANGCQISVSHAEPWANPSAVPKILKWMGQKDAPLLFRPQWDWLQWKWGLHFLRECLPGRSDHNIRQIVTLADYSRRVLQQMRAELAIEYDCLPRGILHFYTNQKEFDISRPAAQLMQSLGCPRDTISADEVVRLEPALLPMRGRIVGGDYTASDESGDIHAFTTALAALAAQAGVNFQYGTTVTRLLPAGSGASAAITSAEVIDAEGRYRHLQADAFVLALGSFSTQLVRPLGIKLMVYPGKGYSATFDIIDPATAPTISLTDDQYKLVMTRLGRRLRVAGTCELSGYQRQLDPVRCAALTERTRDLFPDACDYTRPEYWAGLRPLTPSNVPYVGRTRYANLFLNTGHGTLGWTMGCGSGLALADIISGRRPEPEFAFTQTL